MQPQCGNSSRHCTLGIQTVRPPHVVALGQTVLKDLVVLIPQYFNLNVCMSIRAILDYFEDFFI